MVLAGRLHRRFGALTASRMAEDGPTYTPELGRLVCDTGSSLTERFRALFTLRAVGGPKSIAAIGQCFADPSALFKHECAYVLGQMQDGAAIPTLTAVLEDEGQHVMVRHEAGEALGAIGDPSSMATLRKFAASPLPEIAETCQLALDRLAWLQGNADHSDSKYLSVDPAPPATGKAVPELRRDLLDASKSLFERYRALFALRNLDSAESVEAIVAGFVDQSALFRHEIAYVLGQMQHPASVEGLKKHLLDNRENEMVRHECAEALGSIATEDCLPVLKSHLEDAQRVVKESCIVALDIHEYNTSGSFQYADGLSKDPPGQ